MDKWRNLQKLRSMSRRVFISLLIVWIFFMTLAAYAITQPQYIEQKIQTNIIEQKVVFDYETEELPEGILGLEGIIFPKYQKTMDVLINATVASQEAVEVKGNYTVVLELLAEGLWKKEFPLEETQSFNIYGEENEIINSKFTIDLENIYKETEAITNNIIGISPSKYILTIKPIIEGTVIYNNSVIPLSVNNGISFDVSQSQVLLTGEKGFSNNTPIEEIKMVEQKLNIIGFSIPIMYARYIFSLIALVLMFILIITLISKKGQLRKKETEKVIIEKKYKNRLVPIEKPVDNSNKTYVPLQSFKSLVRLADEKDQGIFIYNISNDKTHYFVIDNQFIYTYTTINH